jgi:hypothetical protein
VLVLKKGKYLFDNVPPLLNKIRNETIAADFRNQSSANIGIKKTNASEYS